MAIGVIAQAVPVMIRKGCRVPISIGINQLAWRSIAPAPAATRSLSKMPAGPTTTSASGAVISRISIGLTKNLIIDGETFSAKRSTHDISHTVRMIGSTEPA